MNVIFTHGKDSKYKGGWTTVNAESYDQAIEIYRIFHPDKKAPFVDCCCVYSEDAFKDTWSYVNGNFGKRCVERIQLTHMEVVTDE